MNEKTYILGGMSSAGPTAQAWTAALSSAQNSDGATAVKMQSGKEITAEPAIQCQSASTKDLVFAQNRLDGYLAMLSSFIQNAGLEGGRFHDADLLLTHIKTLREMNARNQIRMPIQVSYYSGLPTYAGWLAAPTAQKRANGHITTVDSLQKAAQAVTLAVDSVHYQEVENVRMAESMQQRSIREVEGIRVQVADIGPQSRTRTFKLICDRLTQTGLLQRTTVILRQNAEPKRGDGIRQVNNSWALRQDLYTSLYTSANESLASLALTLQGRFGDSCLSIQRGNIGPLWFTGTHRPEELKTLLTQHPKDIVLLTSHEELSRSTDIAANLAAVGDKTVDSGWASVAAMGFLRRVEKLYLCTPGIAGALSPLVKRGSGTVTVRSLPTPSVSSSLNIKKGV